MSISESLKEVAKHIATKEHHDAEVAAMGAQIGNLASKVELLEHENSVLQKQLSDVTLQRDDERRKNKTLQQECAEVRHELERVRALHSGKGARVDVGGATHQPSQGLHY